MTEPTIQTPKPRADGRHRRRARHQGRVARQDIHRRSAGARRLRSTLCQGRTPLRHPRHQAARHGRRGSLQGGRRPQRRRGVDRNRAVRRPRSACLPISTTRNSTMPISSACRSWTNGARKSARSLPCIISARATFSKFPARGCTGVLVPFTKAAVPACRSRRKDDPDRQHCSRSCRRRGRRRRTGRCCRPGGGFDPKQRPRGPRDAGGNR